jgi:hypothetical protein
MMRDNTFDFTPERRLYEQLRPIYDREECLFVPNSSHGLAGYVTFDKDAQRLRTAVAQLDLPEYVARTFQDGTVLWLLDASAERAETLKTMGACSIYFAYQGPWDDRQQDYQEEQEEETDLLQGPWP